jgi:hypothetical protein
LYKFYTGDATNPSDGKFAIGVNAVNPGNNLFDGYIDWIKWQDSAD